MQAHVALPDVKLHGKCNRVVVKHLNVERKPIGDVGAFAVKLDEGGENEFEPLLITIAERTQQHADDWNQGVQTYALYAYYADDRGYTPYKLFRVAASDVEMQNDLVPSEPPTDKGLAAQAMRHLEAILRTSTVANNQLLSSLLNENKRLGEMVERFGQQQIDMMLIMQDLTDNSHGRRLKEKESEVNLAMKEEVVSKLSALVPIVINRIAGQQVMPEEDRSLMLMSGLLEQMTPQQQRTFYQTLTDPQKMVLAEILEAYEKKKDSWNRTHGRDKKPKTSKNALPALGAAKKDEKDEGGEPFPLSMSLSDRVADQDKKQSDPEIVKIEGKIAGYKERFSNFLRPKPTTEE